MVNKSRLRASRPVCFCAQTFSHFVYYDRIALFCTFSPLLNRTTLRLRENEPFLASSRPPAPRSPLSPPPPLRPPTSGSGTSAECWKRAKTSRIYGTSQRTRAEVNGPLKVHAALYIREIFIYARKI